MALILGRRLDEEVVIRHGQDVLRLRIISRDRDRYRLAFEAPTAFRIDRAEIDELRQAASQCSTAQEGKP